MPARAHFLRPTNLHGWSLYVRAACALLACFLAMHANAATETQPCEQQPSIDYASHADTVARLRTLYQTGAFADLDRALECLMTSSRTFTTGQPGSSAVYWMYRRQMPAPRVDPAETERVRVWRSTRKASRFAEFAELRLRCALAWHARGGGYAGDVSPEAWKQFKEGLAGAEAAMHQASPDLKLTPIWHNLLLAIVQDSGATRARIDEVFEKGVAAWPKYFDFYEVAVSRLVPRWGGSWSQVEAFADKWSQRHKATEGDSVYARIYLGVLLTGAWLPETAVDWERMKRSLDLLVRRYPDPAYANAAASLACAHGDKAYFRTAMSRLASGIAPEHWVRGTEPADCTRKLLG
jgi:hypothetical protein